MAREIRIVGLDRILKKLDAANLTDKQKQEILRKALDFSSSYVNPLIPRDSGASASSMSATLMDGGARIAVPSFPLKFHEFGTRYHRRQRFMAKTLGQTRKQLRTRWIPEAVEGIEKEWAS